MKLLFSFSLITMISLCTEAQNLVFEDQQLKELLISESCVNFDGDFTYEEDVDTNDDFEISLEEAMQVQDLRVTDSSSQYNISSVNDLQHFVDLRKLTLWGHDSLLIFSDLVLDSLEYLHLDAMYSLEHIDISSLHHIAELRIEDFSGIEYLNIQNGSLAAENFSLFYTFGIEFACVDSIAAEYEMVQYSMIPGNSPSLFCDPNTIDEELLDRLFTVYPNPTSDLFEIRSEFPIETFPESPIDLSGLNKGTYILEILSDGNRVVKTISKN